MTHIPAIDAKNAISNKANYNAVKIQINNPQTNIPEGMNVNDKNSGMYNAVNIEVNRPRVNVIPNNIYNYPMAEKAVSAQYAGIYPVNVPKMPNAPVAYQTNLINNRTFVNAEIGVKGFEPKNSKTNVSKKVVVEAEKTPVVPEKKEIVIEEVKVPVVEAPKTSAVEVSKTPEVEVEKSTFKAQSPIEIIPPKEILPEVNVNDIIKNLADKNFDKQAQQMEEIAKVAMKNPEKASNFLVTEVFNELINIVNLDTTKLVPPSEEQIEIRKKIIINELVKEEAKSKNEDLNTIKLPYEIKKEEMVKAAELSPMEQAERNKEYSLYTIAILTKVYIDDVKKHTGNVVPLTDLPGISEVVDTLRHNPNPSIKVAAIDALRYIKREEYNEELNSIFKIAINDTNPMVAGVANSALNN